MSTTPSASHRFRECFGGDDSRVLRITFRDGGIMRLRSFCIVDPSIYSVPDQWSATCVGQIAGTQRHFRPDTGVDFVESDVVEISDESSGEILYKDEHVA